MIVRSFELSMLVRVVLRAAMTGQLTPEESVLMLDELNRNMQLSVALQASSVDNASLLVMQNEEFISSLASKWHDNNTFESLPCTNGIDMLRAGISCELSMLYYRSAAEYAFATTSTQAVLQEYVQRQVARLAEDKAKHNDRQVRNYPKGSISARCFVRSDHAPQVYCDPVEGSRIGGVYFSDNMDYNAMRGAVRIWPHRMAWSNEFKMCILRIHETAELDYGIWAIASTHPRELSDKIRRKLLTEFVAGRSAATIWMPLGFDDASEVHAIVFEASTVASMLHPEISIRSIKGENVARIACELDWITKAKDINFDVKLHLLNIFYAVSNRLCSSANEAAPFEARLLGLETNKNTLCGLVTSRLAIEYYESAMEKHMDCSYYAAACHFNEALNYFDRDKMVHLRCGVAYRSLGMWESALECFIRAMYLDPNFAEAIAYCGMTKIRLNCIDEAVEHLIRANRLSDSLWRECTYLTLTRYCVDEGRFCTEMLKYLLMLTNSVDTFFVKQWGNDEGRYFSPKMHYSNFDCIRSIACNSKFRLMSADSLRQGDEFEGYVFFDRVREACAKTSMSQCECSRLLKYIDKHSGDAFLGSFDTSGEADNGRDHMWERYGKKVKPHDGAAIVYDYDCFLRSSSAGWMQLHKADEMRNEAVIIEECGLQRVSYNRHEQVKAVGDILEILKLIVKLDDDLKARWIVRFMLDRVRYLFKNGSFSNEDEARIIVWRNGNLPNDDVVKKDKIGRAYVECPSSIIPGEVLLGAEAPKLTAEIESLFGGLPVRQVE